MKISDCCTQCISWKKFHKEDCTGCIVLSWFSMILMAADLAVLFALFVGFVSPVPIVKDLLLCGLMAIMGVLVAILWHYWWHASCQLSLDEDNRLHLHTNETYEVGKAVAPSPCVLLDEQLSKKPMVVMRSDKSPILQIDFGLFPRARLYGEAAYHWKVRLIGHFLKFTDYSGSSFVCPYLVRDEKNKEPPKLDEDSLIQALQTVQAFTSVGNILTSAQQVDKFIISMPASENVAAG